MTDEPGWYCFRPVPSLAEWDGTAWTGDTHYTEAAPELAGPPRPFAFLRQPWVWWLVAGQALVIPPAIVSGYTGNALWSWLSAVGYLAFMVGALQVMTRFLPIRRLPGLRRLTLIGVGSGVLGFAIGFGLESVVYRLWGITTTLWSTGPIEEGGKLLVPFLLLAFGSKRYKDPLVGLYLVLVSGATVGAVEGVEWESRAHHVWYHLQLAMVRPAAELPHVFVTGFAAAVIWLAARRRGRAITVAGSVAFAIAVGLHSVHDGFITLFGVSPRPPVSSVAHSIGQAIGKGLAGWFFALGIGIASLMLGRHGARELTPPGSVADATPPWRPQIKSWGCVDPVRTESPLPVGVWDPYVHPAYGYGVGSGSSGNGTGHARRAAFAVPGGYVGPPARAPAAGPVPVPVPALALALALATPASPLAIPDLSTPPVAPPGWYPIGDDPGRTAWWSGSLWSQPYRWNGVAWYPE